jgi:hypothetical protein
MARFPDSETTTESGLQSEASFREKASEELREFIILTAYLYVCFAAVIYFKAAILQTQGVAYAPLGLAIIKAALCAKFMLVGRVFHIGERFKAHPLIVPTLHRSFVFLLLLAVLTFIEEIIVGAMHGRRALDSIPEIAGGTFHQIIATTLIIFLILIPYLRSGHSATSLVTKYLFGYSSSAVTALKLSVIAVDSLMTRFAGSIKQYF